MEINDNGVYELLFKKYPDLFRERHLPPSETCMCWGIACGEGWCQLIDDLCCNLHNLFIKAGLSGDRYPVVVQVKEKYATLRFYLKFKDNTADKVVMEEAYALICAAETKSSKTCEVCGEPGECRQGSWLVTRCDRHSKK
jgi:hypothetical protein